MYGSTMVSRSSSPIPPATSGRLSSWPGVPHAGWYSTSGSAPSTRSLLVRVSVALIATFAELMPASAHTPSSVTAFGAAV